MFSTPRPAHIYTRTYFLPFEMKERLDTVKKRKIKVLQVDPIGIF